jgi:protein-S-isoprenylcysteine O-methyltransferase Ste14
MNSGVIVWIWSVTLIFTKVLQKQWITPGPYSIGKRPLYTGLALWVLGGMNKARRSAPAQNLAQA